MNKEHNLELFKGCPIRRLNMPNGDRIVVTFRWGELGKWEELYDTNHNVYRLNPQGEIIWQVQRDDSILPIDIWEKRHKHAREEGADGYRQPFGSIVLEYSDGSRNTSDRDGDGTAILTWKEGCIIYLYGQQNNYILNPNTGIATNVAKSSSMYWYVERIYMQNGDKIILKYSKIRLESEWPYYEANFNLYRLTPTEEVVWYVKKDDDFMLDWWKDRHELEYDEVEKNFIPFASFTLKYNDGLQSIIDEHKDGTNIITWKEECIIYLNIMEDTYVLDPNTGIVTNIVSDKKL